MTIAVEFKNVTKKYGSVDVIKDFNLQIDQGDFLCIVGTSGSGKTTIMKMINGLVKPTSGDVFIGEKRLEDENLIELRRKIGYAIQGNGLFPHMSVFENISYVPNLDKRSKAELDKTVDETMELVGLPQNMKYRYPDELSGGQQQRVGIARAYANNPDVLLMDEPFGAVDSITRYQLQKDLKDIHRKTNCTVVFITHDIHEAFKLATHILVLREGKIEQYGTKEEIRNNPSGDFVKRLIEMTQ